MNTGRSETTEMSKAPKSAMMSGSTPNRSLKNTPAGSRSHGAPTASPAAPPPASVKTTASYQRAALQDRVLNQAICEALSGGDTRVSVLTYEVNGTLHISKAVGQNAPE